MIIECVNDDTLHYIKQIPNDIVDLIILDPDYNDWDKMLKANLIGESLRILKKTGNILCFTKQPFDFELRKAVNPYFRREIVWTFTNGGAWVSNKMPLVSTQKIYWLTKSKEFYFNPRTGQEYSENTKNFKRSNKVFGGYKEDGKSFEKSDDGIWLRDHLHFNKPHCKEIPAKPKELIQILITCFCEPDGIVFDAFAGSGTVMKVADELGRNVIGVEIDSKRCDEILNCFFEKVGE